MLSFKSKGDNFDNCGKRGMRTEELSLDVRGRLFCLGGLLMVKVSNFIGPNIEKLRPKGNSGLLKIINVEVSD